MKTTAQKCGDFLNYILIHPVDGRHSCYCRLCLLVNHDFEAISDLGKWASRF